MDKKLQRNLFQEKVRQMWGNEKVSVPVSDKPLYKWIVPHVTSKDRLNWAIWDKEVRAQENGLKDLIESGNSFFLWKKTEMKSFDDSGIKRIPQKEAVQDYLFDLMLQDYIPILCDAENSEPKQKLVKTEDDARKKIENSIACYTIENQGESKGLAIISPMDSLEYSFARRNDALSCLGLGVGEQKCQNILYLDVIFTKNEKGMRYGSRLLQRIENDYPNYIICLFSVPKRGTLYFYYTKGFQYSDMKISSPNLLPAILDKIDKSMEVWHNGFPLMTQLHAETELRRPLISIISNNINWKVRDDVNIFFDSESLNFLLPTYSNIKEDVIKYVLKNRTCQRIVLMTPLFRMTKQEYYNVTRQLLEAAHEILQEDESISEILVVCDNNESRQLLLRQAAAFVWGECSNEEIMSPELQLPTPEKGYKSNAPRTPPTYKQPNSPPPVNRR